LHSFTKILKKNIKGRIIYFGVMDQRSSHHGSQETEKGKKEEGARDKIDPRTTHPPQSPK
jgi:hypothetical protein